MNIWWPAESKTFTWSIVQHPNDTFDIDGWFSGVVSNAHYDVTVPKGHPHDPNFVWAIIYDPSIAWMGGR